MALEDLEYRAQILWTLNGALLVLLGAGHYLVPIHKFYGRESISKHFPLCSIEERKSQEFGTT